MLICQNSEGVHGQRKFGKPCDEISFQLYWIFSNPCYLEGTEQIL